MEKIFWNINFDTVKIKFYYIEKIFCYISIELKTRKNFTLKKILRMTCIMDIFRLFSDFLFLIIKIICKY